LRVIGSTEGNYEFGEGMVKAGYFIGEKLYSTFLSGVMTVSEKGTSDFEHHQGIQTLTSPNHKEYHDKDDDNCYANPS